MVHPYDTDKQQGSQPPHPTGACPTSHISPLPEESKLFRYEVVTYAGMVEVVERDRITVRRGGGLRGRISGLSKASRRRALETLCKVRGDQNGLFLTLTYPDAFPGHWRAVKRDLDTFLKRLTREYPRAGFFWRIEYKRRKSGQQNRGKLAPHFHMLLFGIDAELTDFRSWAARSWYESNGSQDEKNLRAGTEASHIRSRRHAMYYASKYVAKADEDAIREEVGETGRMWGYGGQLDLSPNSTLVLSRDEYVALRRLVKRWLRGRGGKYYKILKALEHGYRVMGLGDQADAVGWLKPTILRMLPRPPSPYAIA